MELACDVLVVGGGCGGLAAALAASDLGRQVVLTEAGSWLGGQLTSQAVPPDEHPWVEHTGTTARYRQLREAVRARYKRARRLTESAKQDPLLNPGAAWVSCSPILGLGTSGHFVAFDMAAITSMQCQM
jgi:NADPH-dependent 2,4-dienoyl-CoA reductase/sulfur reductase-like enzyme